MLPEMVDYPYVAFKFSIFYTANPPSIPQKISFCSSAGFEALNNLGF